MPESPQHNDFKVTAEVLQQLIDTPEARNEKIMRLVAELYKKNRRQKRRENGTARKQRDRQKVADAARQIRDSRVRQENQRSQRIESEIACESKPGLVSSQNIFHSQNVVELEFKRRSCYGCRERYSKIDPRYHWFCKPCAERNWLKRNESIDLSGRTALVTGARIKIGFATAIKCLRSGAQVHATTRYPKDALRRYQELNDYGDWQDRLFLHGIDFRDVPGLLQWTDEFSNQVGSLDILINNAAQSVKRSQQVRSRLVDYERSAENSPRILCLNQWHGVESIDSNRLKLLGSDSGSTASSLLAQGTKTTSSTSVTNGQEKEVNSWSMLLEQIPPVELLEVFLVNANAPALISARLKPIMKLTKHSKRFIVNVTGTDGMIGLTKSGRHPHINMSKASINMLTRSSAAEFARDGIYMNSVDTGWVTHEATEDMQKKAAENGFTTPLDELDAAARVLDPVVLGISGEPEFGQLFRNFEKRRWTNPAEE